MTISSSLNAGVAGLSANASRLATISDNISNASTYGYKRAEADFHSLVSGDARGSYSAGGVRISTQRMVDQQGSLVTTTNPTDLAVRGRGFLPVTPQTSVSAQNGSTPMLLTTTGSFRTDKEGYLITNTGLILMGWPANPDGSINTFPRDTTAGLEPIQINVNEFSGQPTTKMSLGVNLPATGTVAGAPGTVQPLSVEYFDNMGTSKTLDVDFTPTVPATGASNSWTMTVRDSASGGAVVGEYVIQFDNSSTAGGRIQTVTATSGGPYDPATGKLSVNVAGGPIEIEIGTPGGSVGLSQLSDKFAPVKIAKDGSPVGNLSGVSIDGNGFVKAQFDTGITRTIYQIPLVDMPNPNGLEPLDSQTYTASPESGAFFLWNAGDGPTGDVVSYAREESATDVAGELTDMIQTQRAYSSNAKVIQTVDEMLQETTNIKR